MVNIKYTSISLLKSTIFLGSLKNILYKVQKTKYQKDEIQKQQIMSHIMIV
jgi:hypothetical protein